MALTLTQISGFPTYVEAVCRHAQALLDAADKFPGITSIFATEQRGMMANVGLSLYFETSQGGQPGNIILARFFERVEERAVASRNTADAFIKEMLQYGYLSHIEGAGDKRVRPIVPTEKTMLAVLTWALEHLKTLDSFDGGSRSEVVLRAPEMLAKLQPNIADDLVGKGGAEISTGTLALFAWVNKSKLLFLRILASMMPFRDDDSRFLTDIESTADLARWMNVSRTHLARKLRDAEDMGSLGWCGDRGNSQMWISSGFLKEITNEQAARLVFFDAAYDAVFGRQTKK